MKIEAKYICDKCGMTSTFLHRVFEQQDELPRLCEPCLVAFKNQYRLWCNDPEPLKKVLNAEKNTFFRLFLSHLKVGLL